jgi:Cof subfamily protein (haloacid dehalogenase superfamily)
MIKLVITDLDDTLIDRDEILSRRAIDMVKKLKAAGVLFTLASGRAESMTESYVEKLDIHIPYLTCNGGTIMQDKRVISKEKILLAGIRGILQNADQAGMAVIYTLDGNEYILRVTDYIIDQRNRFDRYHREHYFSPDEWNSLYLDKVTVIDEKRSGGIFHIEELARTLPDGYTFTRYTNKAVEIVHKDATKGKGLCKISELLHLQLNEIMAVGDQENDIEMLQKAGVGAAVANAIDSLKNIADYICIKPRLDGVIEAVHKFIL